VVFQSSPVELTPEPEGPTGPQRFEAFGQMANHEYVVIIERRNAPTAYGSISDDWNTSEPLHTSHIVPDLAAASSFMATALEHEVLFREDCSGPEFEELMAIPEQTRFRFEMLGHPDRSTGRSILIEYEDGQPGPVFAQPPIRGLHALRFDTSDLETTLALITRAGGSVLRGPALIDSPAVGRGQAAAVKSPLGILLEIWQPQPTRTNP
jgi:hypothetical protein